MLALGIDPGGSSGGLALVDGAGALVAVQKMPDTAEGVADQLFALYGDYDIRLAVLEQVSTGGSTNNDASNSYMRPKAAFSFGINYGALRAMLQMLSDAVEHPIPLTWRRRLGVPDGSGKEGAMAVAQARWPAAKIAKKYGDAVCLALYGHLCLTEPGFRPVPKQAKRRKRRKR